ncbi:MAG: branched-chain amino acid ABC transporter permease, partial [Rhodobacteraceae bacterium]
VFSLAQMALFAFGGYVTAMLGFYFGLDIWLAMPVGAAATVVFSLILGVACLRLAGPYVALLTLAVTQAMFLLIVTDTECFIMQGTTCRQFTGGAVGFARFGDLGTRQMFRANWMVANYALVATLFVVTMAFTWAVVRGPIGLAFRALRDNPGCATARGVNRFQMQLLVFAASAFFTGLAGGLYAAHFQAIGPGVLSLSTLLLIIAMVVVGGVGRLWGPFLGAVLLTLADEVMREFGSWRALGLGLIIAAAIVLMPRGFMGLAESGLARLRRPAPATEERHA